MDQNHKKAIIEYINKFDPEKDVVKNISPSPDYSGGEIEYNGKNLKLWREISTLGDEEYVRAYLLVRLTKELGYAFDKPVIELEKSYSIGRPNDKSARIDLLVRYPHEWPDVDRRNDVFLFIECKAPEKFDTDRAYIKGQLFDLARQEKTTPEFAAYFSSSYENGKILDRALIVNLDEYPTWESWDSEGQPSNSILPAKFGVPKNIEYVNVDTPTESRRHLRTDVTRPEFDRLRKELHNVIWGGGGTNNNDVFVILIRLFLCRVYDELETPPGERYRFQRSAYTNGLVESAEDVVSKMSELFREAAQIYLGYSDSEIKETVPFEAKKISPAKVAFVVEQLQDKSLTRNTHRGEGDLLGDFFEGIVSQDFTQTRGQFFTHINLVKFCLEISDYKNVVQYTFLQERDSQGRPRVPKIIDPSCGSGTFMVEAMKEGTKALSSLREKGGLAKRLKEFASFWFGEDSPNAWARDFIYGVEPNSDLGLATKVNMILHGDGSTNVFVNSGLESFANYAVADRSHGLAVTKIHDSKFPYKKECNEEFDFIFTNPPFSISLSGDEERQLDKNFQLGRNSASENLFIERWYQLLRPGGRFVAVVPETILDSSSNSNIRLFLFRYFNVKAVISLPYVAFKPFTSTKTCILYAEKKSEAEVTTWSDAWEKSAKEYRDLVRDYRSKKKSAHSDATRRLLDLADSNEHVDVLKERYAGDLDKTLKDGSSWIFRRTVGCEGVENYEIFLAEPKHVGYKRRKGLPDLEQGNDLISTGEDPSVLNSFLHKYNDSLRYGFRVKRVLPRYCGHS